ncbi:MAG: polysaccharide deacetylase family protein [Sphingomonas sp.]|uniref:polysaccharide deacetylase family protein n=1 Tax=Sphingomonas sp. TaxID=28214 RepID=UPI0025EF776C|nr:polysaccharide deacetylase family protein [Sphingomonas sp.]MBX3564176.1 polysaccharide deacetylase family protein [Sphingomonas sp.]
MTLDPGYLQYPLRKRGMDHESYPYSNLFERPPIAWPSGKAVAVVVVVNLEWFPILPEDKPFRAPGHMVTPYPDYRHYTSREYGTRVGLYRMLDAFAKVGARLSVATNGAIGERYPQVIADILSGGHEIVAHSTDMNGTIASGLPEDEERALIAASLDALEKVSGARPRGWMSIARSQSFNTPRLLAEAGLAYMADWVNDELPYRFDTTAGPIVNVPVNHELSDRQIITVQQQSAESYVEQMQDAYRLLAGEADRFGGRMLPLNLTPYVMGLPYRIGALEALLAWLAAQPGAAFHSLGEIADALD